MTHHLPFIMKFHRSINACLSCAMRRRRCFTNLCLQLRVQPVAHGLRVQRRTRLGAASHQHRARSSLVLCRHSPRLRFVARRDRWLASADTAQPQLGASKSGIVDMLCWLVGFQLDMFPSIPLRTPASAMHVRGSRTCGRRMAHNNPYVNIIFGLSEHV